MSRRALLVALAVVLPAAAVPLARVGSAPRIAPDAPGAFGFAPGELVSDFRWKAVDGRRGRLSAMLREHRAVVVVMRTVECPVSQRYGHRLAELEEAYAAQGVAFLFLDVSPQDTPEMIVGDAAKFGFAGPYVADPEGMIGTLLQAKVSTEVFLIDAAGTLRYRGAVDDQFGITFSNPVMREDWLRAALDEVLAGRPVRVAETEASGCYLELAERRVPQRPVTYASRVSRIVQKNCVSCHRDGGVAPFSLETYQDVYGFRGMVKWVLEEDRMPPWFAHDSVGEWRNDPSLSERDKRDVLAWIEAGAPEGKAKELPAELAFVDGWQLEREPDAVLQLPEPIDVPASGVLEYQYAYVKTDFPEDKWVEAIEVRPTAGKVTHHVIAYLEGPDDPRRGPWLAGTAPGVPANVFPRGTAKRLPKGAWVMFELHYTTNGQATQDQTEMGLLFADAPPEHEVKTLYVVNTDFEIPPHVPWHEVVAERGFRESGVLTAFLPHSHLRGQAWRLELERGDGTKETVLDIPRYDFNWQLFYEPMRPIHVQPGDRLRAYAWFNNSDANPANPDPTAAVQWGEQTFEEMMIAFFDFVPDAKLADGAKAGASGASR